MEIDELGRIIQEQQKKIDAIYRSVEQTRKLYLWTIIITLALFVIPLILLAIVLPRYIGAVLPDLQSLGL